MAEQGTPIYDAMGNFTGYSDPSPGEIKPSPDLAKPADVNPPAPKGGPIVLAKQIKFGAWTMYVEDDNLWMQKPDGTRLQVVMFDPKGVTQTEKPNKLSDGSDGSKDSIGGNNVPVTGQPMSVENQNVAKEAPSAGNAQAAFNGVPAPIPSPGMNVVFPQFNTNFIGSFWPFSRQVAQQYIQRPIDELEWNDLIAAVYAESDYGPNNAPVDVRVPAWIASTVLNRSRISGMNISSVLNQRDQYTAVTGTPLNPVPSDAYFNGPPPEIESRIHSSIANYLPDVPINNYYYENANPYLLPTGECLPRQKRGIQGTLIGNILVYPGAKWP